jgi:GTPase
MRGAARALGVRGQRRRGARLSSAHCPSTPVHAVPCLTVQVRVPTVVTAGSELVVHCLGVKQAARVLWVEGDRLEEGGKTRIQLKFVYAAEFLLEGSTFVFRESSGGAERLGVGVGIVTAVSPTA